MKRILGVGRGYGEFPGVVLGDFVNSINKGFFQHQKPA